MNMNLFDINFCESVTLNIALCDIRFANQCFLEHFLRLIFEITVFIEKFVSLIFVNLSFRQNNLNHSGK